jgi:Nucleoporin complex subunit 54
MVVYDPASDQQRQLKAIGNSLYYEASGTGGKIVPLANPPQLTRDDWHLACLNNPSPETHVPLVVVGAGHLQARGLSHQEQARKLFGVQVAALREAHDLLAQRQLARRHQLDLLKRRSANLQLLLLRVFKYVHIFRCLQQPLQPDEMKAQERLIALQRELMQLKPPATDISFGADASAAIQAVRAKQEENWMKMVVETRAELTKVTEMLREDHHDLKLIRERVIDDVATVQRR